MATTITHTTLVADAINLRHDPHRTAQVVVLLSDMLARGWVGRPVIAYRDLSGHLRNITGCHRIEAARRANIGVSALLIETDDEHTIDMLVQAAASDDYDMVHLLARVDADAGLLAEMEL